MRTHRGQEYPSHVIHYVMENFQHLMTEAERAATDAAWVKSDQKGEPHVHLPYNVVPAVADMARAMLKHGTQAFNRATCKRLLSIHKAEIYANACPQCGRLPATPKARLCIWCSYVWGDPIEPVRVRLMVDDWRSQVSKKVSFIQELTRLIFYRRLVYGCWHRVKLVLAKLRIPYLPDETKCQSCGATLFRAYPGETTTEEIIEFARSAKRPEAELILAERWIHPGEYCPNDCYTALVNLGDTPIHYS